MARRARGAFVVVLLAAALGVLAAAFGPLTMARADGDPASDVLLGESVFYPYTPPVAGGIQKALNVEIAAAKRGGFPIKVALIASPVDLGVIPDLFNKPQTYADFLDQEISFRNKQPLLVVMPAGYGVQGLPAKSTSAAAALTKPTGSKSDDLATAAISAVAKLAAAAGHPVSGVPNASGSSSGGGSSATLIIAIVAAAALAAAGGLLAVRCRQPAPPR